MSKATALAQVEWPVVQIKESHDLAWASADVGQDGATAVVPVFSEMRPADTLTIRWEGFYAGHPEEEWDTTLCLDEVSIEQTPLVYIPYTYLLFSDEADVSYEIMHSDGSVIHSPVQRFQIDTARAARLAAPGIEGHDASQPINPGRYPDGIVVQVPAYSDMQPGDYVVLYADGRSAQASAVRSQQVQQVAALEFAIDAQWLLANQGANVTLLYQYARPGAAKTSEALVLSVLQPLDLPPPIIERAAAEGGAEEHKGVLKASVALSGVYVQVPESVPLGPGDQFEVHWQGDPAGGQHIAPSPADSENLKRFFIPATAVAANMGGEDKRFEVFYRFLKVKYFDIKTHREPSSTLAHAENSGEGEVLVFITMEGGTNGTYPAQDDDLKFLIPQGDYSSTTVLGQRFLMDQILVEGLKDIASGSSFDYRIQGEPDGFVTGIEILQGRYKGPPMDFSSPSFAKIHLSGFELLLTKSTGNNFQLSVVEDELLQIEWSGSAEQECTVAPPGGSDIYGRVVASWKFSIRFRFDLVGEDGELNLTPLADGKFEQLKIAPGTLADHPTSAKPFKEIADVLEPQFSRELNACMNEFAAVVARVDAFRLNSLLFRGDNIVRFTESKFPGDLALFGQLAPQMDVFDISPLEYVIGQGGTHTFTTVPAQNVTWEVEKIEGYTGYAGAITPSGVYTAPVKSELEEQGLHFVRVRIKATGAGGAVAYALVTIVIRPISINPLVTMCNASSANLPQTREFAAGALAAGELSWHVVGTTGSSIGDSVNVEGGKLFTAGLRAELPSVAYTLDEVVVTDSQGTSESSWVLVVHKQQVGEITIADDPAPSPGQINFQVLSESGSPVVGITWTLLKGGGELNEQTGIYTVNEHDANRFALIAAYKASDVMSMNCYYILPLPLTDLPVLKDMLDKSNRYFELAGRLGMAEAARLVGFNQD